MNREYVGISTPTMVFIGVASWADFDRLDRPLLDCGRSEQPNGRITHALTKSVEQDGVLVIFQFWLEDNLDEWMTAQFAKKRAEAAA